MTLEKSPLACVRALSYILYLAHAHARTCTDKVHARFPMQSRAHARTCTADVLACFTTRSCTRSSSFNIACIKGPRTPESARKMCNARYFMRSRARSPSRDILYTCIGVGRGPSGPSIECPFVVQAGSVVHWRQKNKGKRTKKKERK